jgi:hypothetical protein
MTLRKCKDGCTAAALYSFNIKTLRTLVVGEGPRLQTQLADALGPGESRDRVIVRATT